MSYRCNTTSLNKCKENIQKCEHVNCTEVPVMEISFCFVGILPDTPTTQPFSHLPSELQNKSCEYFAIVVVFIVIARVMVIAISYYNFAWNSANAKEKTVTLAEREHRSKCCLQVHNLEKKKNLLS